MIDYIIKKYPEVTDIHMTENEKIIIRIGGVLVKTDIHANTSFFDTVLTLGEACQKETEENSTFDVGTKVGQRRLRIHGYQARGKRCLAIRVLPDLSSLPKDPDEKWLNDIASWSSGLMIISGTAGSGKSTTLARIVSTINEKRAVHIVLLEDPAEYVFPQKKALIHQKEIGRDTTTFADGVKEALREDPDIIVIGEMRDRATMEAALTAAETGHLVLATLHNRTVEEAVGRIVHAFPAEEQKEIRAILSSVLRGVVAQRLWRKENKTIVLREILTQSPSTSALIREGKENQLSSYMETGYRHMRTFKQAIYTQKEMTDDERKELLALMEE